MRIIARTLASLMLSLCGMAYAGDLVVVVNPSSGIDTLSKNDVINIFMSRYRTLPSGIDAVTVDHAAVHQEKSDFYWLLVGKELSQIDSYWARLRFSGKGRPPIQAASPDEVIELVANNKGAIGYIDKRRVDKRLKVVFELPDRQGAM